MGQSGAGVGSGVSAFGGAGMSSATGGESGVSVVGGEGISSGAGGSSARIWAKEGDDHYSAQKSLDRTSQPPNEVRNRASRWSESRRER